MRTPPPVLPAVLVALLLGSGPSLEAQADSARSRRDSTRATGLSPIEVVGRSDHLSGTAATASEGHVGAAELRLAPGVRVEGTVLNLLNAKADEIQYFYASRLPGEPSAGVGDIHFHPVEPRQVRIALAWGL